MPRLGLIMHGLGTVMQSPTMTELNDDAPESDAAHSFVAVLRPAQPYAFV